MGFKGKYECIIHDSRGIVYNFYLNENSFIECIHTGINNQWKKKSIIYHRQQIQSIFADIDEEDNIYIVSCGYDENIRVHFYKDGEWNHELLTKYSKNHVKLYYPVIKIYNKRIHVFYYKLTICAKQKAMLFHLINEGRNWEYCQVIDTIYEMYINPFKVMHYDGLIYVLFTNKDSEHEQICTVYYNPSTMKWSSPLQLTNSNYRKLYIEALIDSKGYLHCTWCSYDEESLAVKYEKIFIRLNKIKFNPLSLSERSNCSFPLLIYYKNVLWIVWTQMDKLMSCHSFDNGECWSAPQLRKESINAEYKHYLFATNNTKTKNNIQCDFVYGKLYPNIQFIGFGGE